MVESAIFSVAFFGPKRVSACIRVWLTTFSVASLRTELQNPVFDKFFAEFGMFISALFAVPAFSFFVEFAHLVGRGLAVLAVLAVPGLSHLALVALAFWNWADDFL